MPTRRWDKSKPPLGPWVLNKDCPQAQGLVAWYPFAKAGGLYVPDHAGNYDLTAGTAPTQTLDQWGAPAASYASASNQRSQGTSPPVTSPPFTIAAWVRHASLISFGELLGVGLASTNTTHRLMSDASGLLYAQSYNSGGGYSTKSGLVAGKWHHCLGEWASSTSRTAYLDNVAGTTDVTSVTPTIDRVLAGNSEISDSALNGTLTDGCFWNKVLSADVKARLVDPGLRFELRYPLRSRKWISIAGGGSTGTLAKTNANDTSAASGTTTIVGTLAKTNANDTSAASGTTTVVGTLAKTNANDSCAASGTAGATSGTVAYTNINDSVSAAGWAGTITGTLATTNANDTVVASGTAGSQGGSTDDKKRKRRKLIENINKQIIEQEYAQEPLAEVTIIPATKAMVKAIKAKVIPYDDEEDEIMLILLG